MQADDLAAAAFDAGQTFDDDYRARCATVYGNVDTYERQIVATLGDELAGYYRRARIVLQPKQLEYAAAVHAADEPANPREIGMGGAQSGGKSFASLAIAGTECQRFAGLKVLYLRYTALSAREQLYDQALNVFRHVACEVNVMTIRFPNGSRIVIGGFKDDRSALAYLGQEYDLIIVEEATQLREHTYITLMRSLRSSKGYRPRILAPTNPLGVGHIWYKQRFVDPARRGERGKTAFIPATVDDNAFVDADYVLTLEGLHGAELRAYRFGDWDIAAGAFFETWDYDTHVIPPLTTIPGHWDIRAALDAGFFHWNMTYFGAIDTDGNWYVFHELAHRKKQPGEIAPDIRAALAGYQIPVTSLKSFTAGMDAFNVRAGQEKTLADQYAPYGINLAAADVSPGSRAMGAQEIARLLGDPRNGRPAKLFITSNCRRLIECLPYLQRDPSNLEDVIKVDTDELGRGGDDPYDGLRYLITSKARRVLQATVRHYA